MKVEAFETKFDIGQWVQLIGNPNGYGCVMRIDRTITRGIVCTTYRVWGYMGYCKYDECDLELRERQEA